MPGVTAEMKINNYEEEYILNDTQLTDDDTKSLFISFFNSFNNAYFESIENDQNPDGEPEITITYTLSNNTVNRIEYIPVPREKIPILTGQSRTASIQAL